jgi:hypothetical protein
MNADVLRKLYPSLTDEELRIAGENLDAYLALAWEIFQDMQAEATSLTDAVDQARIQGKVDSPKNNQTQA